MKRRTAIVGTLAALGTILLYVQTHRRGASTTATEQQAAGDANKHIRHIDGRIAAWKRVQELNARHLASRGTMALDRELALRELMRKPLPIKKLLRSGAEKWVETLVDLEDYALAREERLGCGRELGEEITEPCQYRLVTAVERTGPREGTIRSVEAAAGERAEESCRAYADCVGFGRIGKNIALPDEPMETYAIEQTIVSPRLDDETMVDPRMKDVGYLRDLVQRERLQIEDFKATMDLNSAKDRYLLQSNLRSMAYEERILSELVEQQ